MTSRFKKYENEASRFLTLDGGRVHYRDEGLQAPGAPALLLLHGVMASLHTWDGWVEELAPHYRILRIDLPGFGLSENLPIEAYTPEASADRLDRLRKAFGLERFHLGGNSLGGFLSWYYAATYPERVGKMVLVSPVAYPQKLPAVIEWVSRWGIGEVAQRYAPRFIVENSVREVYGDPLAMKPEVMARYYELLQHGNNRQAMVQTFRTLRAFNANPELAKKLPTVRAPTLLMWGERDRWVPPSLIELWKRDVPNLTVKTYPGIGHVAMEELPGQTARDAHAFLAHGAG